MKLGRKIRRNMAENYKGELCLRAERELAIPPQVTGRMTEELAALWDREGLIALSLGERIPYLEWEREQWRERGLIGPMEMDAFAAIQGQAWEAAEKILAGQCQAAAAWLGKLLGWEGEGLTVWSGAPADGEAAFYVENMRQGWPGKGA